MAKIRKKIFAVVFKGKGTHPIMELQCINAGHSTSEVGPLAGHPMSGCFICSMRLATCNGG